MVLPTTSFRGPLESQTELLIATATTKVTTGLGDSSTTIQSASALPSTSSNPLFRSVRFIWNCITRFCILLYGLSSALCNGMTTDDSINNNVFLTWLNQSQHHFKGGIEQISKHYQASLKHKNPREEFFKRVDELKNQGYITGKNAYHLKQNFSMPNIGSGPVNHDAVTWYAQYDSETNSGTKKQMRAAIFQDTKRACKNGFIVDGKLTTLDAATKSDMQNGTRLYSMINDLTCRSNPSFEMEKIEVINGDTIDVTLSLKNKGYNPVAMNMANETHPGGGVENGAAAQEESLFRRSNYHESLDLKENPHLKSQMSNGYHIPERGVIYSPNVQVFRASEKEGFAFTAPETISFIAVAAYNLGFSKNLDSSTYAAGMKEKMRSFLRVAHFRGHDCVVLGTLGCGAFRNKPDVVAKLFKETLQEDEFAGRFKKIVFAVIDDHNGKNFKPFSDILKDLEI